MGVVRGASRKMCIVLYRYIFTVEIGQSIAANLLIAENSKAELRVPSSQSRMFIITHTNPIYLDLTINVDQRKIYYIKCVDFKLINFVNCK